MNKITITLTEDQFHHIIRGLEYTKQDFMEEYGGDEIAVANNKEARKENAFVQRLIDKLYKQAQSQNS